MLARKLGIAATVIGLAAGGSSYLIEMRHAEQAALKSAAEGSRHFESSAMQMLATEEHNALSTLLDRTRFVGIRVFNADKTLIYETWESIPPALIEANRSHQHDWPKPGESDQNWIEIAGERLIQVVLPISGQNGTLVGYLESVNRLDAGTLRGQQEQVQRGALTAVASVLGTALFLYPLLLSMLRHATGLSNRLLDANLSLLRSLGNAIAKRDSNTDAHNYRVTSYAVALAVAMQVPDKDISHLVVGAFLHDVGKIGIPDSILRKPGKLTENEFEIMKTHVLLGIEIVADNPWLEGALLTIRHHHEHFDGTGYPDGLRDGAIPLTARIFAVADVFDALTSERPYKRPMPLADALSTIESQAGRHFDQKIVAVFRPIARDLYARLSQANDLDLRQDMRDILTRYFSVRATDHPSR